MKRYLLAAALIVAASPAMAAPKTCLDWVRFLASAIQLDAKSADERLL